MLAVDPQGARQIGAGEIGALQLRTGVAMVSYADNFVFGITADYDTAPDIEALAAGIEDGVARLLAVSRARRGRRGPKPRVAG